MKFVSNYSPKCFLRSFCTTHEFAYDGKINWFPGHMAKATREMKDRLSTVDIILEIRDARIPFTSQNPLLDEITGNKSRIVIFNKADLADHRFEKKIIETLETQNKRALFVCANNSSTMDRIIPLALEGRNPNKRIPLNMLVAGIPNVGKSTIINCLRFSAGREKTAKVGALPGVTRQINGFKVSDQPPAYLIDSPGVMLPSLSINQTNHGFKFVLVGSIRDSIVPHHAVADFLLFTLNKLNYDKYVEIFGLEKKCSNVDELLEAIAKRSGAKTRNGEWNLHQAACSFIHKFRTGALGRITLDDVGQFAT